jgi:carbon-monoxide dehydrogenase medium subunit
VKPVSFEYRAPATVDEAVSVLAEDPARTTVLAGGQSLLIELRYRTARPRVILDVNQVGGLDGLGVEDESLRIGALVRHAQLEHLDLDDPVAALMAAAAPSLAHPPIRARGTFAGSLAYAHPAAEWGALAVALDATVVLMSSAGERQVPAASWFRGPFSTARRPDELVTSVAVPLLGPGWGVAFSEHRRTHGTFAQVAVLAAVRIDNGRVRGARLGVAGGADRPLRATGAEGVLAGAEPHDDLFREAGAAAAAEADPVAEPHCSVDYRRHLVDVLTRRVLAQAAAWN